MKLLNVYITEAWGGVKQHALKSDIEAWCKEMGIINYTINSQGEIDVDGGVDLSKVEFKELPYKFGIVDGHFSVWSCKNLTSLKNCPDKVEGYFSCSLCPQLDSLEGCPKEVRGSFFCRDCSQLDSLKGCPKKVRGNFWCGGCKGEFTKEEVKSLCKVKKSIIL